MKMFVCSTKSLIWWGINRTVPPSQLSDARGLCCVRGRSSLWWLYNGSDPSSRLGYRLWKQGALRGEGDGAGRLLPGRAEIGVMSQIGQTWPLYGASSCRGSGTLCECGLMARLSTGPCRLAWTLSTSPGWLRVWQKVQTVTCCDGDHLVLGESFVWPSWYQPSVSSTSGIAAAEKSTSDNRFVFCFPRRFCVSQQHLISLGSRNPTRCHKPPRYGLKVETWTLHKRGKLCKEANMSFQLLFLARSQHEQSFFYVLLSLSVLVFSWKCL